MPPLVTGGGRSVGRGIAEVLASAGAFVYVNDLHEDRATDVVAAIESNGNNASAAIFDVTDASAVDHGFNAISADGKRRRHPLVNNTRALPKDPRRNCSRSRVPKTGCRRSV